MAAHTARTVRIGRLIAGVAAIVLLGTACSAATGRVGPGTTPAGTGTTPVGTGTTPVGTGTTPVGTGTAPVGTVTGKFLRMGGPMGPHGTTVVRLRGQIRFIEPDKQAVKVRVGKKGTFRVTLPVGRYQVIGRTPDLIEQDGNGPGRELPCSEPLSVTVTNGHTSKIKLICAVP